MAPRIVELAGGALARAGVEFRLLPSAERLAKTHPDMEAEFAPILARALPETMTTVERMYSLWQTIGHVQAAGIPGDFVECGVWRGGSSMVAASRLKELGDTDRQLWLYDTFEGMNEPTAHDVQLASGRDMSTEWDKHQGSERDPIFAFAPQNVVERNMQSTGYPQDKIHYVRGKVEETLPATMPEQIAILRLDTDWYESTKHELEHLWDRLVPGGVLIIDDYGYWAGCRQAVDEFFASRNLTPFLHRVDVQGRLVIKGEGKS